MTGTKPVGNGAGVILAGNANAVQTRAGKSESLFSAGNESGLSRNSGFRDAIMAMAKQKFITKLENFLDRISIAANKKNVSGDQFHEFIFDALDIFMARLDAPKGQVELEAVLDEDETLGATMQKLGMTTPEEDAFNSVDSGDPSANKKTADENARHSREVEKNNAARLAKEAEAGRQHAKNIEIVSGGDALSLNRKPITAGG